jgi:aspartyl/glutamyl-tRNA(Asn/Gln) amidotransferase C subunit
LPIGTREVEKIAELAHLKFDREELERFVGHFQQILEYFAQLETVSTETVSTENVESAHQTAEGKTLATPMREDETSPSLPVATALDNAPDPSGNHFRVPPVIE